MKAIKLKLGTHMDIGLMCIPESGLRAITFRVTSLDRFYSVSLMKNFLHIFLRNYESCKVETCYTHGQWLMYSVYQNQGQGPISLGVTPLDRFYNFIICHLWKIFVTHFSRTERATKLKFGTNMNVQWVVVTCVPESEPRAHNSWSYIPS